jgi:hypothetical protein
VNASELSISLLDQLLRTSSRAPTTSQDLVKVMRTCVQSGLHERTLELAERHLRLRGSLSLTGLAYTLHSCEVLAERDLAFQRFAEFRAVHGDVSSVDGEGEFEELAAALSSLCMLTSHTAHLRDVLSTLRTSSQGLLTRLRAGAVARLFEVAVQEHSAELVRRESLCSFVRS